MLRVPNYFGSILKKFKPREKLVASSSESNGRGKGPCVAHFTFKLYFLQIRLPHLKGKNLNTCIPALPLNMLYGSTPGCSDCRIISYAARITSPIKKTF